MAQERLAPEIGETEHSRASVVFLQETVPTFPSLFSLWLFREGGHLAPGYRVFPKIIPGRSGGIEGPGFLSIFPLALQSEEFQQRFWGLRNPWLLKRFLTYAEFYQAQLGGDFGETTRSKMQKRGISLLLHDLLTGIALRYFNEPETICAEGLRVLDYFVQAGLDPLRVQSIDNFQEYLDPQKRQELLEQAETYLSRDEDNLRVQENRYGVHQIVFPKFLRDEKGWMRPGETRVAGTAIVDLPLGRLKFLEGKRVSLVIVGPPGSGKSSLTASLVWQTQEFLQQIRTSSIPDLSLSCGWVDLDPPTPDTSIILGASLERKKIVWTRELATQTTQGFLNKSANIIFADAPGGNPNLPESLTKPVVAPADCALVLTKNWQDQTLWRNMLKALGIFPAGFIRSWSQVEVNPETSQEIQSAVTHFGKDEAILSGRIVGLKREIKIEDLFLSAAVPLLLIHILPEIVRRRDKQKRQLLTLWRQEYQL